MRKASPRFLHVIQWDDMQSIPRVTYLNDVRHTYYLVVVLCTPTQITRTAYVTYARIVPARTITRLQFYVVPIKN